MSYILEALKKAEAERKRGAVPDLHAQPAAPAAGLDGEAPGRAALWLWLVAGMAAAMVAALAWQWTRNDSRPEAALAPPVQTPRTVPEPPPLVARPTPNASADASAPAVAATPPAAVAAPKPEAASAAAPAPPPAARTRVAAAPKPPSARVAARSATRVPPAAASAPQHLPSLAELPDDVRRQVPPMTLGGSTYSPDPASRMVIVNGQVLREGATVAPELQLERIGPKSAVFTIRGQRFETPL